MLRFLLLLHTAAFALLPSALAASPAAGSTNTTAAAAAGNAGFPTCDSGISRLVLANLDHLPTQCRPGHRLAAAAVIECFTSSRAVVHKCRVILLPGKPSSRSGLDCSVLHAQGMLTGPSSATLMGVVDGPKVAALLVQQRQPGNSTSSSRLFQGMDTAKLQQQLVQGMQMLFSQVVVTKATTTTNTTTSSSSSSRDDANSTTAQHTAAGTAQPQAGRDPSSSAGCQQAGPSNSTAAPGAAGPQSRRHHQRHRPTNQHNPQQARRSGTNSTSSASEQQQQQRRQRVRPRRKAAPGAEGEPAAAGASENSSGTPPPAAAASSSSAAGSSSKQTAASGFQAASSAATSTTAGSQSKGRKLLQGAAASPGSAAPLPTAVDASGGTVDVEAPTEAEVQAATAAAGGAAAAAKKGAVLHRQDRSILLQPSSSCRYQFLVTRNPSFLQPDPALAAQQQQGARDSIRRRRSSSKGAGWWVSAGALFAGVSAVLALAVCYMSAQIWSRYKSYEALPSQPAPSEGQQQAPHAAAAFQGRSPSPAIVGPSASSGVRSASPELSVELQQQTRKSQAGPAGDNASLQDQGQ